MAASSTTTNTLAQDDIDIASILASMNQQSIVTSAPVGGLDSLARPVDYSAAGHHEGTMVVEASGEVGAQPLNLATIAGGQRVQVRGIKRFSQGTPEGSLATKKIITR